MMAFERMSDFFPLIHMFDSKECLNFIINKILPDRKCFISSLIGQRT